METVVKINSFGGRVSGAMGGFFWPSHLAKAAGVSFDRGNIMAYCFRRFGYPVHGWDDYKELCSWYVTTRMPGVYLSIRPSSGSPFGFMLTMDIYEEVERYFGEHWFNKVAAYREWAMREHGVFPVSYEVVWYKDRDAVDRDFTQWMSRNYPEITEGMFAELPKEKREMYSGEWSDFKDEEHERLFAEFEKTYEAPEPFNYYDNWPELPWYHPVRLVNDALTDAIRDLLRPVNIRDVLININGDIKYGDLFDENFAPVYKKAGCGLGDMEDLIDNKDWDCFKEAVSGKYGDLLTGIRRLTEMMNADQ
jgi:hypothetical protein